MTKESDVGGPIGMKAAGGALKMVEKQNKVWELKCKRASSKVLVEDFICILLFVYYFFCFVFLKDFIIDCMKGRVLLK